MTDYRMTLRSLYAATVATLQSRLKVGHNVYKEDWDALIILDACRVDALHEIKDEYDFLETIESRWSRGSTSKEWLENTFIKEHSKEIGNTTYISANYYATHIIDESASRLAYPMARNKTVAEGLFSKIIKEDVVSEADFGEIRLLFNKLIGEDELQLHPRDVTDCAINTVRKSKCDRTIIHYMQPHHPFLRGDQSAPWNKSPFRYLENEGCFEKVWDGYLNNLRLVLDHVEELLENMDAKKTVITSDHGELFGEWGLYSHGVGIPHPNLRKVPWVETSAQDTKSQDPDPIFDEPASEDVVENRLDALGYR